jgi:hypothetical protein
MNMNNEVDCISGKMNRKLLQSEHIVGVLNQQHVVRRCQSQERKIFYGKHERISIPIAS